MTDRVSPVSSMTCGPGDGPDRECFTISRFCENLDLGDVGAMRTERGEAILLKFETTDRSSGDSGKASAPFLGASFVGGLCVGMGFTTLGRIGIRIRISWTSSAVGLFLGSWPQQSSARDQSSPDSSGASSSSGLSGRIFSFTIR